MATALPKAEHRCPLKGGIAPARQFAARRGAKPNGLIGPDGRHAWKDFAGFLVAYDAVAALVRTPEDYRVVVRDDYRRAAGNAEKFASLAEKSPHPYVPSLGMGGDENREQPKDFSGAFAIARAAGLHAGDDAAKARLLARCIA